MSPEHSDATRVSPRGWGARQETGCLLVADAALHCAHQRCVRSGDKCVTERVGFGGSEYDVVRFCSEACAQLVGRTDLSPSGQRCHVGPNDAVLSRTTDERTCEAHYYTFPGHAVPCVWKGDDRECTSYCETSGSSFLCPCRCSAAEALCTDVSPLFCPRGAEADSADVECSLCTDVTPG